MWDKPQSLNWIASILYSIAALLFFCSFIFFVIKLPIFLLREVVINSSLSHITRTQLEEVIKREIRGNFFTLNLDQTRQAFEKLPWVRAVDVRRHWPDRLEIRLIEHVPLARWSDISLVNSYGELFNAAYDYSLPHFVAPEGTEKEVTQHYFVFKNYLEKIKQVPQHILLTQRRAWRIKLESGVVLELGREQVESRLANFITVYGQTIGRLSKKLDYVDLRYSNGFAIRVPGDKA